MTFAASWPGSWSYARPEGAPPIPGNGDRLPPESGVSLSCWTWRDAHGRAVDARLILIGPLVTPRFFAPEQGLHIEAVRLHPEWRIVVRSKVESAKGKCR
ncbi:MAG TPA: hypothetical protein VF713_02905 [Thermoanaerobaculia bacterium]